MTLGEASFCNAAEPWLLSLLKDCDAVSTDNDEEGLPSSDDIESESKLALILGLHRVTEVAKWSLEALLHVLGKGADDM